MLDLLLSIPDMLLTMGLPAIDQSLDKLLAAMETFPKAALMGDAVGFARVQIRLDFLEKRLRRNLFAPKCDVERLEILALKRRKNLRQFARFLELA